MAQLNANGLTIEYEEYGSASNPAILLIMGLAAQLTHWPPAMIDALVKAGYRVIAFDNRDIGLTQKLHAKRSPRPARMAIAKMIGLKGLAPYTLKDMAKDTVGVLDALSIERAHVIGVSMGGMIGQVFAAQYPSRIAGFVPIMTSTNNPKLPKPDSKIINEIFSVRTKPRTRDELIDRTIGLWGLIGTKDGGNEPVAFRKRIAAAIDRCNYPAGIRRQIAAIIATGDLRAFSKKIEAPTLVIHGSSDPLVPFQGGLDIAATINGAKVEIIDEMGHDLPPKFLSRITELVVDHLRSSEETVASAKAA